MELVYSFVENAPDFKTRMTACEKIEILVPKIVPLQFLKTTLPPK
ncbi:hypothetical protein IMCC12053_2844 [Celeribacter marinus]|uniref:Uncharacterized protein n=1 Tax=Celeribacter marinus TaxID=1397108 RepID=A0A0P0AEN5_9RHOB|nr:hypothetical protein IMCC12053_2844 [Celeribacter marinus]